MNKTRRKIILKPKLIVLFALLCIAAIGMFYVKDQVGQLQNLAVCVSTGIVFDLAFGTFFYPKRKLFVPDGAIVTGLIVAMVLSSSTPWYICSIITGVALLSKHLLAYKRKPVLNPAAFGLFIALEFFSSMQSWWGGLSMLPVQWLLLLLVGGYWVTQKVNKFPQVLTFLGTYFLLSLLMGILHYGDAADAIRTPFINSVLFLAFFMLTDPPTSPALYKDQIQFGAIAAVVSVVIYSVFGGLAYLLLGLLVANVWWFLVSKTPSTATAKNKTQFF